jgi:glyoxylase I family protein
VTTLARGLDHVSFVVDDLDGSRGFYRDVLGCDEIERPDLGFPGAWLRLGAVEVHLVTPRDGVDTGTAPRRPTGFANHVAFAIDDLAAARSLLEAHGIRVQASDVGIPQLFVQDPSGNVIELIERRP